MLEMKKFCLTILFTFCFMAICGNVLAGNCDYSWQTASDGSSCGGRAASMRPGGR